MGLLDVTITDRLTAEPWAGNAGRKGIAYDWPSVLAAAGVDQLETELARTSLGATAGLAE
jgi:hypothetical protein